jgi:hypothetical protein
LAQVVELPQQRVLELDEGEHRAQLLQEPALLGLDQVAEAKVGVAAPGQELLHDPKKGNVRPGPRVHLVRQVLLGGSAAGLEGGRPRRHVEVLFGHALAVPELHKNRTEKGSL